MIEFLLLRSKIQFRRVPAQAAHCESLDMERERTGISQWSSSSWIGMSNFVSNDSLLLLELHCTQESPASQSLASVSISTAALHWWTVDSNLNSSEATELPELYCSFQ